MNAFKSTELLLTEVAAKVVAIAGAMVSKLESPPGTLPEAVVTNAR